MAEAGTVAVAEAGTVAVAEAGTVAVAEAGTVAVAEAGTVAVAVAEVVAEVGTVGRGGGRVRGRGREGREILRLGLASSRGLR